MFIYFIYLFLLFVFCKKKKIKQYAASELGPHCVHVSLNEFLD